MHEAQARGLGPGACWARGSDGGPSESERLSRRLDGFGALRLLLGGFCSVAVDNCGHVCLGAMFVCAFALQGKEFADEGVEMGQDEAIVVAALGATLGVLATGSGEKVADLHGVCFF